MQKRTSGYRARSRWLVPIAALSMLGCPKQELAPLAPCTVSSVREEVNQTGISKVDLLFVIDNSRSMKEEQEKLRNELPRLIRVLTTGDRYIDREDQVPPGTSDDDRYFTPVSSLQLGVTTSELAVMLTPSGSTGTEGCVEGTDPDDGRLLTSVDIAVNGQNVGGEQVVPPNPDCADVDPPLNYLQFETANKTEEQILEDATEVARQFSCISTVGVLGCAYEQQLEAMWKAVAPSTQSDFIDTSSRRGHGNPNGVNKNFVRDDAILTIIQVSDEEDCSVRTAGRVLFETPYNNDGSNEWSNVPLNLRCGTADEMGRDDLIQPVERYINGMKSLKAQNPDRIIFTGIVGLPQDLEDEIAQGQYDLVLADQDMQFRAGSNNLPVPSCTTTSAGDAYPPRRFVQTAAGFGENAALFSICRADYGPAVDQIIDRIASKLKGNCLPRQLTADDDGLVRCEVYEILPEGMNRCDPNKGHVGPPETRTVNQAGMTVTRTACKVQQVPVMNSMPQANLEGWYYDSFSEDLKEDCPPGEQQRIVFTEKAQLGAGSGATFECFQPVATITANSRGFDAINTPCSGSTDEVCGDVSDDDYTLICIEDLHTCQVSCAGDPDCPPGWVCATINDGKGPPPKYCQQPTCQTNPTSDISSTPDGG